ncbi:hypothetical protein [Absidia glauca]|uniref:IPT/TIG domain-containing protein n=1 Tax=Absidia glauca TaxID=4829 RepID=A0A163K284_ABSGL|nr:hypothetical protein [Absidia glauca]
MQQQQPSFTMDADATSSKNVDQQHSDKVMDLFLQQVNEYSTQHLSFDDRMTGVNDLTQSDFFSHTDQSENRRDSTAHDFSHLSMPSTSFLGIQDHSAALQQQGSPTSSYLSSPSSSSTGAAAVSIQQQPTANNNNNNTSSTFKDQPSKQNTKEGSSLLHVFTNPLLHAIPMLARNCLNFEDFLTQASVQGQNGLLGFKDANKANVSHHPFTSPHRLMTDTIAGDPSMSMMTMEKPESPWHVKVLGLPSSGAKSRVETQIKICIQLTNSTGELATNWSHLMLPEHMVARDKLKRRNPNKYGTAGGDIQQQTNGNGSPSLESDILKLEAAVVCDGHADNEIIMCSSCVHRERKRMKRKRDNKVARAVNKEGGAAKLAALFANDLPDLSNDNVMAEERRKILLFNCSEYVDFSNGEATLPTRVTCYCRHHSEKVGFRIVFTIKDGHNHVLGTGRSPPIMITDDHKSPKTLSSTSAPQATPSTTSSNNRKRSRNDEDFADPKQHASSKRKINSNNMDADSDSGVSSPVISAPATPISANDEVTPTSPGTQRQQHRSPSTLANPQSLATDSGQRYGDTSSLDNPQGELRAHLETTPKSSSSSSSMFVDNAQGELFDFLNASTMNGNPLASMNLNTNQDPLQPQQQQQQQQQHMMSMMHQQQQQLLSHFSQTPFSNATNRRRTAPSISAQQQRPRQHSDVGTAAATTVGGIMNDVYTKMFQQRRTTESSNKISVPRLHRLIPAEGPIYGGSEVTVLGSNFYEGLTCLFGESPAIPTHCWSANTLLCILPPAATAGPVVVSFKEHPLMLEGQDVVLFTYFDESDRALMELALQVVGLKTMGKVEDARQIAMRIVQGSNNNQNRRHSHRNAHSSRSKNRSLVTMTTGAAFYPSTQRFSYRHYLTPKAAQAIYDNAHMLFYTRLEEQIIGALLAANAMITGTVNNAPRLWVKNCISLTNQYQHTLLHLAAIRGYDRLVRVLVHNLECDVDLTDRNGFTALHFASWTGKVGIVRLLLDKTDWTIETVTGKTAWQLALDAGHHHVVALFQDHWKRYHYNNNNNTPTPSLHLSRHKRSPSRSSSVLSEPSYLSSSSTTTTIVRIPLIDIIPSSAAVSSAKSILPEQLFNALSSLYIVSTNTPCIQQLGQSVSTVYTSMLDPF